MRSVWLERLIISVLQPKEQWPWKRYQRQGTWITSEDPTTEEKSTLSKCTSRESIRRITHAHIYSMHVHASTSHAHAHAQGIPHSCTLLRLANQDVLERRQIPHFNGSFGSGKVWERYSERRDELWS